MHPDTERALILFLVGYGLVLCMRLFHVVTT